jgi:uncharacterized membrane protein
VAQQAELDRWVSAGLITAEQAQRIAAFEQQHQRPSLLYAVAGTAGLAIAVGIVSIVAANWDGIPGRVKIGCALAMLVAAAAGVWEWERRKIVWAKETAIVVLWGLVLGSIALVGQVYQLGGRTHLALATWSVLTAMLMSRGQTGAVGTLWILGVQATWIANAIWLAERFDDGAFALATIYWPPLICVALGSHRGIAAVRPALSSALRGIGWSELVLCACLGTLAFYEDTAREGWESAYAPAAASAVGTAALAMIWLRRPAEWTLLLVCLGLAHVPLFTSTGDLGVVAAVCFIGLWLAVAWLAYEDRERGLLNLATAMIGLRILIVYFEVFGTLLDTGLGLVLGGTIALLIVWGWTRGRKYFEQMLGRGAGT